MLAFVRDITEREQSEERLRKTMTELERFNRLMYQPIVSRYIT